MSSTTRRVGEGAPAQGPPSLSQGSPSAASLQRLVRAVRDLASARTLEEIVEIVRHAARELVDADGATFVLRDRDQCYYVDEDAIEPLWRGQRFPLEACVSGWSMLHREVAIVPDIYADARIPHEAYRPTFVRSLTMTPIRTADPLGAIGTYWASEHASSPAEAELLQTLADSTAVALESVRVLSELEDRVRRRTAELEASNRDLEAFAELAAHDLKTPLVTIAGYAEHVRVLDGPRLSDDGAQALDTIQRRASRMSDLIDAVLGHSAAASAELAKEPVDFNVLVEHVLHDLGSLVTTSHATVEVHDLPPGHGVPALLERVLQNLIANAIQYGAPGEPHVLVTGHQDDRSVSLTITDNGSGVPHDEREAIFDMFMRGQAGARVPGSGIGLAFARRVVVRHGGTISVAPGAGGRGASFSVTLPLASGAVGSPAA